MCTSSLWRFYKYGWRLSSKQWTDGCRYSGISSDEDGDQSELTEIQITVVSQALNYVQNLGEFLKKSLLPVNTL